MVPDEVLRHERHLEELLLDANQIQELPRVGTFVNNRPFLFIQFFIQSLGQESSHLSNPKTSLLYWILQNDP